MSIHSPQFSKKVFTHPCRIAIVASCYNTRFVDALVAEAQQEILHHAPKTVINIVRVPGAFEIPLALKLIAERDHPDAILALGVIIRGESAHADLIAGAITAHLLGISLQYKMPVIHEVLMLDNEAQAAARCLEGSFNRGREAAQTALSMIAFKNLFSESAEAANNYVVPELALPCLSLIHI